MTPEDERRMRKDADGGWEISGRHTEDLRLLLSEIDRLRAAPVEVFGPALEEARDKFDRHWGHDFQMSNRREVRDAVNYALGLFSGIVLRRMKGEPDPDAPGAQS